MVVVTNQFLAALPYTSSASAGVVGFWVDAPPADAAGEAGVPDWPAASETIEAEGKWSDAPRPCAPYALLDSTGCPVGDATDVYVPPIIGGRGSRGCGDPAAADDTVGGPRAQRHGGVFMAGGGSRHSVVDCALRKLERAPGQPPRGQVGQTIELTVFGLTVVLHPDGRAQISCPDRGPRGLAVTHNGNRVNRGDSFSNRFSGRIDSFVLRSAGKCFTYSWDGKHWSVDKGEGLTVLAPGPRDPAASDSGAGATAATVPATAPVEHPSLAPATSPATQAPAVPLGCTPPPSLAVVPPDTAATQALVKRLRAKILEAVAGGKRESFSVAGIQFRINDMDSWSATCRIELDADAGFCLQYDTGGEVRSEILRPGVDRPYDGGLNHFNPTTLWLIPDPKRPETRYAIVRIGLSSSNRRVNDIWQATAP